MFYCPVRVCGLWLYKRDDELLSPFRESQENAPRHKNERTPLCMQWHTHDQTDLGLLTCLWRHFKSPPLLLPPFGGTNTLITVDLCKRRRELSLKVITSLPFLLQPPSLCAQKPLQKWAVRGQLKSVCGGGEREGGGGICSHFINQPSRCCWPCEHQ